MKKVYLMNGLAVVAMALAATSCSRDLGGSYVVSEEQAFTNAESKLGVEIDPNQTWKMTQSGTVTVTADAGIDATEVLILDSYPFGNTNVKALSRKAVEEGKTITLDYTAPKTLTSVYVAVRNGSNDYRVKRIDIGTEKVSFSGSTASKAPTRAAVAVPSVASEGEYSYNAKIAHAWVGVNAALDTKTPYATFQDLMGAHSPWNNSGWDDKYYQVTGSIEDSEYTEQDALDIYNTLQTVIPEGGDNLGKAQQTGYSIITKGGEVKLTPIHASSNSNDQISYYYYPVNNKPTVEQIKKMKKYTLGCMGGDLRKTYKLVYEDASGNVSYDFPPDYEICFIVSNTSFGEGTYPVYESGGITTTSTTVTGGDATINSLYKYTVPKNKVYKAGDTDYGTVNISFGRWVYNLSFAETKASKAIDGYEAYIPKMNDKYDDGETINNPNGHLTREGATTYFFRPGLNGKTGCSLRLAVSIGATKGIYVYKLNDWLGTEGTIVGDYDNKVYSTEATTNTIIEFPVEDYVTYAVFADGSKLGFFGCELVQQEGGTESTTTTVSDVVTTPVTIRPDYYADGALNTCVHQMANTWGLSAASSQAQQKNLITAPHNAVFSYNGKNYLGFEDWVDFDYNDLVFELEGTKGGEEIIVEEVENAICCYAFEDTWVGDYDMNDVVLKVQEDPDDSNYLLINLVASGATLDLNIWLYPAAEPVGDEVAHYSGTPTTLQDADGHTEVHDMFGVDRGVMVNTGATTGANAPIVTIRIEKGSYNPAALPLSIYSESQGEVRLAGAGAAPFGVVIPADWKWPTERIRITSAYNNINAGSKGNQSFATFASDANGGADEWYNYPTGSVMQ